jgi:fatty acid desaturase
MSLRTTAEYVRELKPLLPPRAFLPAHSRLLWLPLHLASSVLGICAIGFEWLPAIVNPLLSLWIGASFAGLVFLGHETLHGAVVRHKGLRHAIGCITFAPFLVSPRLWVAWHNGVHHGNANRAGLDPDAYPTLDAHRSDLAVRIATDWFSAGRRRLFGLLTLSVGLTVQGAQVLIFARKRGYLNPREHGLAVVETSLCVCLWLGLLLGFGPLAFVWACLVPWLVANAIVMVYIITNHSLSPHTAVNDPLANSLSVTVPRWVDVLTLRFGFHVEHHLFPWMSSRHAPFVRDLVRERWPEQYQSMPLHRALLAIHRTARVYANDSTLYDPATGETFPALGRQTADQSRPLEASTAAE